MPAENVTLVAQWSILIDDPPIKWPTDGRHTGNPHTDSPQVAPVGTLGAVMPPKSPAEAQPAEASAQDPGLAAISDGEVPEAMPEPEPEQVPDGPEPLSDYAKWALFNLILTIMTGVFMILHFLVYPARRRKGGRRSGMRLLTVAATVIAIILFVLTEDMSLPMGMADRWTVWHVAILAAAMALAILGRKRSAAPRLT